MDNLTFALFRTKGSSLGLIGIAQGNIPTNKLTLNLKKQKIKATRYRDMDIYPMSNGQNFVMLDPSTMIFGDISAVKHAIDADMGEARNVNYNAAITDQLASVQNEPIWSILDAAGTQNMIRSALGEAAGLALKNIGNLGTFSDHSCIAEDTNEDFVRLPRYDRPGRRRVCLRS